MTQPGVHTSSHLDRKSLKQPDPFILTVRRWLEKTFSKKEVWITLLTLTVIALGASFWISQRREIENDRARDALFLARQALEKENEILIKAETPPAPTAKGKAKAKAENPADDKAIDPAIRAQFKALDVDATFTTTVPLLQRAHQDFAKTRAGFSAGMILAKLYMDHGQPAKALPLYEQLKDTAREPVDRVMVHYSLGYALENTGKPADALKSFVKALDEARFNKNFNIRDELRLAAARSATLSGDKARAKIFYEEILKESPNTEAAKFAAVRLTEVQ